MTNSSHCPPVIVVVGGGVVGGGGVGGGVVGGGVGVIVVVDT